ncbi:MAG TPA: Mur ligase family protein, partial [Chloroflexota bacterium]
MQLQRLLRDVTSADVADTQDIEILDITYDSRQVSPGALFVAVPSVGAGPESGGTTHIHEAVARGAVAVVTESDTEVDGISTIRVPDARTALADLAAEYFGHPSKQLNVFAVTGTDGKTTTSYLLEAIASEAGYTTGMIGTIETKIGERREPNPERMTTPESLDVQRLLRTMVDTGVT